MHHQHHFFKKKKEEKMYQQDPFLAVLSEEHSSDRISFFVQDNFLFFFLALAKSKRGVFPPYVPASRELLARLSTSP